MSQLNPSRQTSRKRVFSRGRVLVCSKCTPIGTAGPTVDRPPAQTKRVMSLPLIGPTEVRHLPYRYGIRQPPQRACRLQDGVECVGMRGQAPYGSLQLLLHGHGCTAPVEDLQLEP